MRSGQRHTDESRAKMSVGQRKSIASGRPKDSWRTMAPEAREARLAAIVKKNQTRERCEICGELISIVQMKKHQAGSKCR